MTVNHNSVKTAYVLTTRIVRYPGYLYAAEQSFHSCVCWVKYQFTNKCVPPFKTHWKWCQNVDNKVWIN